MQSADFSSSAMFDTPSNVNIDEIESTLTGSRDAAKRANEVFSRCSHWESEWDTGGC
jgi:ethanolamine utilization microcompartment shell protein EutL